MSISHGLDIAINFSSALRRRRKVCIYTLYTYMCIYIYIYMYTYVYIYIYNVYMCTYHYIHIMCVYHYKHTYIYIYIYIYTHMEVAHLVPPGRCEIRSVLIASVRKHSNWGSQIPEPLLSFTSKVRVREVRAIRILPYVHSRKLSPSPKGDPKRGILPIPYSRDRKITLNWGTHRPKCYRLRDS